MKKNYLKPNASFVMVEHTDILCSSIDNGGDDQGNGSASARMRGIFDDDL